jgi:heat shock protein HslJ
MSDDLVREKVRLYATEVTPTQLPSFGGVAVRRRRRRVRQALAATSSVVVVALVVVLVALVSHTSAPRTIAPSGSLESQLVGPTWTLQQLSVGGKDVPVSSSNPWTLQLAATTYQGEDGCNSISGDVTYGTTTVNLHFGEQTAAACPGAQLQEAFRALESGPATAVTGGRTLTLTVGSRVLRLAREDLPSGNPSAGDKLQPLLTGHTWLLQSITDGGSTWRDPQDVTLVFSPHGYRINPDCNEHFGTVSYAADRLVMQGSGQTDMGCAEADSVQRRSATVTDALFASDVQVSISGTTLTLTGSGVVMTFTQGPAPATTAATTAPVATIDPGALQANLEGVSWALRSVSHNGKVSHVPASQHARLYLSAGNYYFDNGCSAPRQLRSPRSPRANRCSDSPAPASPWAPARVSAT